MIEFKKIDSLAIVEYDIDDNLFAFVSNLKLDTSCYYQSNIQNFVTVAKYDSDDSRFYMLEFELNLYDMCSYSEYMYHYDKNDDMLKELYSHVIGNFDYNRLINPYKDIFDTYMYHNPTIRKYLMSES